MAKSIQLSKSSTTAIPDGLSYRLLVTAHNAQNMPAKIFVNQRIRNFAKNSIDDVFVAVCTPVQLEDFEEDSPEDGTSYFRTDSLNVVVRTAELVGVVFESLKYEVQKLVDDLNALESLTDAVTYEITSDGAITGSCLQVSPTIISIDNSVAGQFAVNFAPPLRNNIMPPVRNYEYTVDGGITWRARTPASLLSPILITGLESSTDYLVKIRAVDSSGSGGHSNMIAKTTAPAPPV
jgi:hypothetical protein